ncbi:hypothetical protein [Aureimonas altamirensis]|uniref:hypothetical protein n=1 Tax=Aureimonas altamirensis TaxID=370622 RepID=UPI00301B32BA
MPNRFYPTFKDALLSGDADLADGAVTAVLIDADDYAFSSAHDALNDIPAGARIGPPQVLASKTITNGTLSAGDVTFPNVPAGGTIGALVIYISGSSEATSRLVAFFDTIEGLPVLPNGGDIEVAWDDAGILYV